MLLLPIHTTSYISKNIFFTTLDIHLPDAWFRRGRWKATPSVSVSCSWCSAVSGGAPGKTGTWEPPRTSCGPGWVSGTGRLEEELSSCHHRRQSCSCCVWVCCCWLAGRKFPSSVTTHQTWAIVKIVSNSNSNSSGWCLSNINSNSNISESSLAISIAIAIVSQDS